MFGSSAGSCSSGESDKWLKEDSMTAMLELVGRGLTDDQTLIEQHLNLRDTFCMAR